MKTINFYARHDEFSIAGGFETEEDRDNYIKLSMSNNHSWRVCDEEEAHSCEIYHNHYTDQLIERYGISIQGVGDFNYRIVTDYTPEKVSTWGFWKEGRQPKTECGFKWFKEFDSVDEAKAYVEDYEKRMVG